MLPIWRLSVDQYHAMVRGGVVTAEDPIELLDGWLVCKMPKNPPHRLATRLLRKALEGLLPPAYFIESQEPITLPNSEPEPDLVVVRGLDTDYADRHPGPADVALVIEVSDTTLPRGRGIKKRLYAEARIAEYWIVNLIDRQVEVYRRPDPAAEPDYQARHDYRAGEEVAVVLDSAEVGRIAVDAVLPPP
jgi:Uma2 family endonuclease